MKCSRLINVLLLSVFISSATPAFAQPERLNFISNLKGTVQIKRSKLPYQQANFGDQLSASDRIRVAKGAMATVMCGDLTPWSVPAGKDSLVQEGCKGSGQTVLYRNDRRTGPTRSGDDPTLPYLISPRDTALLGRQPLLRWHNISAAPYKVTVSGGEVNWSTTASQPQVVFPGDRQQLKPGFRYRVTVVAQDGRQTAQDDPVSFTFLSDEQIRQVQQEIQQVKQLPLDPAAQVLTLVLLHQHYDLKAEASNLLETAAKKGIQTTATTQLLGELYQQSGLPRLAKDEYVKALQLAKVEKNLEGQAMLQTHLGQVNESLDQLKEALLSFQAAKSSYQALGDTAQVRLLQQQIDNLANRTQR